MKYIVVYTAKRKNAKRHVVCEFGARKFFDTVEEAKSCYMFRSKNHDVCVMTSKFEPVDG